MKPMSSYHSMVWLLLFVMIMSSVLTLSLASRQTEVAVAAFNTSEFSAMAKERLAEEIPIPPEPEKPKALSKRIVEYHMVVELDAAEMSLLGSQSITWKNPGQLPVKELYFHLYPNAFESKHTTFMKESGGKLREDRMRQGAFGNMRIISIKTTSGEELSPQTSFVQPDDGNPNDRTLMKLTLPAQVNPGERITLLTQFSVKLPEAFARMGYAGDYVLAGQWFPKLAVYERKGTRGRAEEGWSLHQYHGNSEFYSDFGIYNVKIKVPENYTVAATGFPAKQPVVDGAIKTYHYYADDVHDLAWAASPHFVYHEEAFSAPNIPGMKIKLYMDPDHVELKSRYLYAAKRSLSLLSQWYGTYPYSTLSIVVPPKGGNGTGGMEYPTLITAWEASDPNPDLELERVIVHEIAHQYWYGMVASNEFEEAWLDEGFTSYSEDKIMAAIYKARTNRPLEASYITNPASLKLNAWEYDNHRHYADNVYTRSKLVLTAIEDQIGEKSMLKVLQTYFQRWKFDHPSTHNFQLVLEEVTNRSWDSFFDQFVYGGLMVDYSVEGIRVRKVSNQKQGKPIFESTVVVKKNGGSASSIPIVFRFADGSSTEKTWDGLDDIVHFKLENESPVEWVAIDPNHTIILENKHMNNFVQTNIDKRWAIRWNMSITKLIETLLNGVAW